MLETLVVVIIVALLGSSVFLYLQGRNTKQELHEYKKLRVKEFDDANVFQKEAQARIEGYLETIGGKDILIDRAAQAIETSAMQMKERIEEITGLTSQLKFQEDQYAKLFGQKKSSEVRTGKITEQIAPFLEDYPLNPKTARFIGDPIDFVHFDEDGVTFVEVKSGKSQLSKKQRMIRDLIKEGKVEFTIYRVEGK